MSPILGHKLLLDASDLSGYGVPESRDPLFYYLLLGQLHRMEEEIWRWFLNRP